MPLSNEAESFKSISDDDDEPFVAWGFFLE
jgi:hypothetical protein